MLRELLRNAKSAFDGMLLFLKHRYYAKPLLVYSVIAHIRKEMSCIVPSMYHLCECLYVRILRTYTY